MSPGWISLAGGALAFLLSTVGTDFVRRRAGRWKLLDVPGPRSSHRTPIPRGGGLGLLFGVLGGLVFLHLAGPGLDRGLLALLLGCLPITAVGLWDDRRPLQAAPRLLVHLFGATVFVWANGGLTHFPFPPPFTFSLGSWAGPAAVVWVVGVTNFFNFMDGIDGLAAGQAAATALGVVLAGWASGATGLAAVLMGACAGFLVHNWSPAKIFLGDVGSGTLGFLLAGLPLLAPPANRPAAVVATGIGLALFLLDPLVTLVARARRRARLTQAHREHVYQRLLAPDASHGRVALVLVAAAAGLSVLGAMTYHRPYFAWPSIALAILLFGMETAVAVNGAPFRYLMILVVDAMVITLSLYLAFFIRFEGRIPAEYLLILRDALLLLVPLRLVLNLTFGLHRWSFRMSGFHEAVRLVLAAISGSACVVAFFSFFQRPGLPRSVIVLEFFLTTAGLATFRFSPRLASGWYLDQRRARRRQREPTIIVGAGSAGDLLLRDLLRSDEHPYQVVGFVDDDRRKIGTYLGGRPVLCEIERLPEFAQRYGVTQILIAIPRVSSQRIRTILQLCSTLKIQFKTIPVSFSYLYDRITASMLHDLSPEDLLPRDARAFDPEEIGSLIRGKRLLVTGAAGSIGGEIARQVSEYGPASLMLVDINENELYFLFRDLRERFPDLDVRVEIADIRDPDRLARIAGAHPPQYVFHAAAHKHVPLMEDAPDEAVKNNVFGTLNVARMAVDAGAERFVLISTDKAVRPSSVMGATKRVAEQVVRELDRTTTTRFTAVRFGNVLGSSGSVVPLFKRQIARGGPVTVTHPDCRRYFMTVSEAVGLVILAGLGDYGDLCVLDMGEPIRILDLAHHMITMAGLAPGVDIGIEFTGLRPGEKLVEELLTEEEDQTQVVRNRVLGVRSPLPPRQIWERLAELRRAAEAGDRPGILAVLRRLVPTFSVEPASAESPGSPEDEIAVGAVRSSPSDPAPPSAVRR